MITLYLRGVPVYCSAVPGHYCLSHRCDVRLMHTVAGKWRVSTIGRCRSAPTKPYDDVVYEVVGAHRFGETMIFSVEGCTEDEPEGLIVDSYEVALRCYQSLDSRVMEQGHLAILDAVCALVAASTDSPETIDAAVGALP